MTPKQRVALAARETSEQVAMLGAWLEQNGQRVGSGAQAARQALLGLTVDLDTVQQALERPPGVGVVATSGSGHAWLVSAILALGEQRQPDAARRPLHESFRSLLAGGSDSGTCACLRIRATESLGGPEGYPFSIGLIGLADLVLILVRAYFTSFPGAYGQVPDRERIAALYEEVGRNVAATPVPGLPERDVHALRDGLNAMFPDAVGLRALAALGYWEDLAEVSGHLPLPDRTRALSLLWGEQADLTRLFEHLADAIARLGFASEAFCPRDALLAQGPTSGWAVRHPQSIIDALTLTGLGDDSDAQIRIVGRYGHRATLARSTLAALISEIGMPAPVAPLAASTAAELIVFPTLRPPCDLALPLRGRTTKAWLIGREQLTRSFVHAKGLHLFERSCRRHEVTSLVVAVDPGAEPDDALASAIGDWIDLSQGATPHDREHSRTRLFVVATRPENADAAPWNPPGGRDARWRERLDGALCDTVGGALEWPAEWVPGQPFGNIYLFQHPDGSFAPGAGRPPGAGPLDRRSTGADMLQALLAVRARPRHYAVEAETIERQLAAVDGGAALLVKALAPVSQTAERYRLLRRQLADLRRSLRVQLYRLNAGDDAGEVAEWRRQIATVAGHRIEGAAQRGRLGLLLRSLGVREPELEALFWRRRGSSAEPNRDSRAPDEYNAELPRGGAAMATRARLGQDEIRRLARRAVAQWVTEMRRTARAGRIAREIGIAAPVLQFIVDEICIGAERCGLERRLAEVLAANLAEVPGRSADSLFASCAGPVINGFVERLEIETAATSASRALARVRARAPLHRDPDLAPQQAPTVVPRPLSTAWCEAFGALVEANLATARLAGGRETDPELARLLAQVPLDMVEAEL